jgi:hypothetical protein
VTVTPLSQSTNEVMKVLTVVATLFIPLTFVVGVYGMDFAGGPYNMPELGWTFGYPAVMVGMLVVALVMLCFQPPGVHLSPVLLSPYPGSGTPHTDQHPIDRPGLTPCMAERIFDRETLLDLTVNVIPLGILVFFFVAFAVVAPWGFDPLISALQFAIVGVTALSLVVLTYYSGKAISTAEKQADEDAEGDAGE